MTVQKTRINLTVILLLAFVALVTGFLFRSICIKARKLMFRNSTEPCLKPRAASITFP